MENLRETRINETRVEGREKERGENSLSQSRLLDRQFVTKFSDVSKDNRERGRRIHAKESTFFFIFLSFLSHVERASSSDNGRGISGDYVPFSLFSVKF